MSNLVVEKKALMLRLAMVEEELESEKKPVSKMNWDYPQIRIISSDPYRLNYLKIDTNDNILNLLISKNATSSMSNLACLHIFSVFGLFCCMF